MAKEKVRVTDLAAMKAANQPICAVTAYDYPFARLFDEAGIDVLLVGDSLGMVVQGAPNTLAVTLDEIIYHTRMVARGRTRALLVADMPFMSFQVSPEEAVRNAGRLLKEGGAEAVKVEGGAALAPTVRRMTEMDIPVMGHVGLTPQSIHRMGGMRVQGRKPGLRPGGFERVLEDAEAIAQAGVFALVVEGVPVELAARISERVAVPTIGIGASAECDGQVLVMHDLLGLNPGFTPRFVKVYAQLWQQACAGAASYIEDVRQRRFPAAEHLYHLKEG
ncbi:MAG: 3-methyl-2-oxobutanoate hydroxymethyltransferase [Deltaproteobacteria bacterium]|jgi:3-methyl-2-oxobutanoate hydroxymethyltransferase|nr:3-methyl-2-oxobutanoate hydroxymethyltransferase [Deltaproteobacteria bacterium]